jgi:hypothetical protein
MRARVVLTWLLGLGCALAGVLPAAPAAPALPRMWPRSARLAACRLAEQVDRRFSAEYTLTNGAQIVKIEAVPNLDRENADRLVRESLMSVDALYASALSPYPGDISKQIVSDTRYQPEFVRTNVQGLAFSYYLVYANARLGHGAVTPDVVKYRSLIGWVYCESSQTLFKVRHFVPLPAGRDELESFFLSFRCP